MRVPIIFSLIFFFIQSQAQQKFVLKIVAADRNMPVAASIIIKETGHGYATDTSGMIAVSVPDSGNYTLSISAIGYKSNTSPVYVPSIGMVVITLENAGDEMDEVVVQSTRTSRTIANTPTRVETIALEEIDEKNNMRPGNVAMLLHESTGIQVQQTSATSANASIRLQGLDGRYTQLLKDGFANFGNFASTLSVLEIPPLDLQQVEIIKGPASTMYGGGAIAGVVNFISKKPGDRSAYNMIINQSSIGQTNIGGFASGRNKYTGYTLLALYSKQKAYDADKDDFTEVPKTNEYTIHPKLFIYPNERTTIILGNSFQTGDRTGGDMEVINGKTDASHQYFEKNKTIRNITTFELDKKLPDNKRLTVKQSLSIFDRTITLPAYTFAGIDYNAYTDLSYITSARKHAIVIGGNLIYSDFREKAKSSGSRNNQVNTAGLYVQHTLDATDAVKFESGLRIDVANLKNSVYAKTEFFVLPRISLLVKYNSKLTSRIGGGLGYKTPTIFTETTETIQYRHVSQLQHVQSERSYGSTADMNYKTDITDELSFGFNQLFFYTIIEKPLVLQAGPTNQYSFVNARRPLRSAGSETNARFIYKSNLKLFLGYTFTDTKAGYLSGNQTLPLTPRHKLNSSLIYEKAGIVKIGLEGYFTGQQYLSNGTRTPAFQEFGLMAEKIFNEFSLYINFENITDTRQSRYKNVVNGSHIQPAFDEIWTHTEGFVVNGGIKIKL